MMHLFLVKIGGGGRRPLARIPVSLHLRLFHPRAMHIASVMASLHRRQDSTVSSCRRCELSWQQSQTVFSSSQYIDD